MFNKWPHGAVMEAWQRCLFGLMPSTWGEPCATVAFEAMAAGRAVIASDIGGFPDMVVHEGTGLLVKPNDVLSLQLAMQRLLADPTLRDRLGQAGRARVRQFSASAIVPQIEGIYRELIQSKREAANSRAPLDAEATQSGQGSDG
jgi:glycosyltransferase involved in cell wall biosynthesis